MTNRLSKALQKLNTGQLNEVARFAEVLGKQKGKNGAAELKLDWVGCLLDAPEKSGVDAAHGASRARIKLLTKRR